MRLPNLTRLLALLALPLGAVMASPSAADAGVYKVYSCKTPEGNIVPVDGWSLFQNGGASSAPYNTCNQGGGLDGSLNGDFAQAPGVRLGWRFTVPGEVEIDSFKLWRFFGTTSASEANATPFAYVSWPTSDFTPDARGECVASRGCTSAGGGASILGEADVMTYDVGASVKDIYVLAGCGGSATCVDRNSSTPMARAIVKAFEARLRDSSAPVSSDVTGPLASNPVHTGQESLSYNASDTGAGVYRTVVELRREAASDWAPVDTQIVDRNGGDCADAVPSTPDPYEFVRRIPCKPQVGGSLALDTTKIPNGAHELRIALEDAAGNRSTLLGPMAFNVSNAAGGASGVENLGVPTNGVGASNSVRIVVDRSTRKARKLRFGQKLKLVATIRNEQGAPVRGATVDVLQRIKLAGARFTVARTPLKAGNRGKIRWTVPAGASRQIRLAYRANLLNSSYQSITDLPLEVSAATTLRRNKRSYSNGQTIRFTGKVRSKPIPKGGVLIDLQAYKRGAGWVTFATKRSSQRGRWAIRYKLVATTATVRYRFRARVRQDSGYPYAAGKTKPMPVLVRP